MSRTISREPIPAHHIGEVQPQTLIMKVYVRSGMRRDLPTKEEVENAVASYLLHRPRLDTGAAWDVSSVIIPSTPNRQQVIRMVEEIERHFDVVHQNPELANHTHILKHTLLELLGLESE